VVDDEAQAEGSAVSHDKLRIVASVGVDSTSAVGVGTG